MLEKRIWMIQGQNTTCIQYRALRTPAPQTNGNGGSASSSWRNAGRTSYSGPLRSSSNHYGDISQPVLYLTLLPFVTYRPYNRPRQGQGEGQFQIHHHTRPAEVGVEEDNEVLGLPRGCAGCTIETWDKKTPYHLVAVGHGENQAQFLPTGVWYWNFLHRRDQEASLPATDDLYLPGVVRSRLRPDKDSSLTIIVSAEEFAALPLNQQQVNQSYEQALDYQRGYLRENRYFGEGGASVQTLPVLPFAIAEQSTVRGEEFLQQLCQTGQRLFIERTIPYQKHSGGPELFFRAAEHIPIITPGYYEQEDNTREMLIALPGLAVTTRRYSEAQRLLRYLGRHFRQGLLPDRLPTVQRPELEDEDYGSADTTLWYFYALDKYLGATRDYELLDELYLRLAENIDWYTRGTSHGIRADARDGLLYSGAEGQALTWMNAVAQGVPVTPRAGKAVEINALWYHALLLMGEWARALSRQGRAHYNAQQYIEQAELCRRSFNARFWYEDGGYLFDVIDTVEGSDKRLRPNQLLAGSLRHAVLDTARQTAMLDKVTQELMTPRGLRTLTPRDPAYRGQIPLLQSELPHALHQGAAWPWLVGPYIDTMLKVSSHALTETVSTRELTSQNGLYQEYVWRKALQVLEPFRHQMQQHMLGNIAGVYAGDAPHEGGPRLVSALSTGEILRIYSVLARMGVRHTHQAIPVEW